MIRVMIVDDEYIMRQGLKYIIDWEKEGYEIVGEATNGNEALGLIDRLEPQIIICDIVMPVLDGVDFTAAVHNIHPNIQIIILSGYDNFEYVKQTMMYGAVDYILKPSLTPQSIKEILSKASRRLMESSKQEKNSNAGYERAIERYLLGINKDLHVPEEYFLGNRFSIYAFNMKVNNIHGKDVSDVLKEKVEREIEKFNGVQKSIFVLQEEILCILFCYDKSLSSELRRMVEELNDQLIILSYEVFGVLSTTFEEPGLMSDIYSKEILKNVDKAFYYEGKHILMLNDEMEHEKNLESGKFDFHKYNQLLLNKQYNQAVKLLIKYNERALECKVDVYGLKNQIKNMIYHFLDFQDISDDEKEKLRRSLFDKIGKTMYESSYRECLEYISKRLLEITGNEKEQTDDRIDRMLEYIERNYKDDIKLEDLAEEFNFNYHYLSAYFNQHMNEGFSDYLNRIRIEKACRLLEQGSQMVSEISGEVGYADHSYFCRVFKKVTGKTPSAYRRSIKHE